MPNNIPPLYEAEIRLHCGAQSFERGRGYFRNGAILAPERQGGTLRALCAGSAETPYRVRVSFDERGIAAARCSCPIGHNGTCKHVAALLHNWLQRPADFVSGEDLPHALERRSKGELVALLTHILQRYPDLEELLDLPLPGGEAEQSFGPEAFRRQAAAIFVEHGEDWTATTAIADGLNSLVALGDAFRAEGKVASAAEVYGAVTGEITTRYRRARYGERALIDVIDQCLAGLEECLANATTERAVILDVLLAVFFANQTHAPELDLGYERVARILAEHTTPDERRHLAERVRADDGEQTAAGAALLFDLEKDALDDETFLGFCRERGYPRELIDRLLDRGRVGEAIHEVEAMGNHSLLLFASSFLTRGHGDALEKLVQDRLTTSLDPDLLGWLAERLIARGDLRKALRCAERVFDLAPSIEHYRNLRELAESLGRWEEHREGVFGRLNTAQYRRLLARILFEDGEIERAIAATSYLRTDDDERLLLEIARAAETKQPEGALTVYKRLVDWRIGRPGSDNYQAASLLLQHVHSLYTRLERQDEWERYAAELRDRTRSLPAFHPENEMDVASL